MSNINQELINKYKNDKLIIKTYYQTHDKNGKLVNLKGIINPLRIDNRQLMSPTDNQKDIPGCAGWSACTLVESMYWKNTGRLIQLDAAQVYAKAKMLDGCPDVEGTYLEKSLEAALELCDLDVLKNKKIELFYNDKTSSTIETTKFLIHKYDFLQVGFIIDEGWYDVTNENYYIKSRGNSLGGHAVNIVGYDEEGVYVLNQWGRKWGANGYAIMKWNLYLQSLMYGAYLCD